MLKIIELIFLRQLVHRTGMLGTALAFMTAASLGASGTGRSPIKETGK
jgi:hypothetical protein